MSEKKFHQIFRAGTYTVLVGGKVQAINLTEQNIQEIVDLFDPAFLDAPITLDHVKSGPAFGWVEELKKENDILLASFKDVNPEFQEAVNKKQYKRISAEILLSQETPKGTGAYLRAVTFLGANSPAVKGLKEVNFAEDSAPLCIDFHEPEVRAEVIPEMTQVSFGELAGGKVLNVLASDSEVASQILAQFTDMATAKTKAEADLKALRLTYRKNEYKTFLNESILYGSVTPAQLDDMLKVMESLDSITQFQDVEGSAFETYKASVKKLPKIVEFAELATKKNAEGSEGGEVENQAEFSDAPADRQELHRKIQAKAKELNISYAQASTLVSK